MQRRVRVAGTKGQNAQMKHKTEAQNRSTKQKHKTEAQNRSTKQKHRKHN
jgi:hypothetical protein